MIVGIFPEVAGVDFGRVVDGLWLFGWVFGWLGRGDEGKIAGCIGGEVFDYKFAGCDFLFADDDAVCGDFDGVGEFVTEFFAREGDGGTVTADAEFVS